MTERPCPTCEGEGVTRYPTNDTPPHFLHEICRSCAGLGLVAVR